jgi:hypothetical protein
MAWRGDVCEVRVVIVCATRRHGQDDDNRGASQENHADAPSVRGEHGAERRASGSASARGHLLLRGPRPDRDLAYIGVELGGVDAGASRRPVLRRELEEAVSRPLGEDARHVADARLWVHPVQVA